MRNTDEHRRDSCMAHTSAEGMILEPKRRMLRLKAGVGVSVLMHKVKGLCEQIQIRPSGMNAVREQVAVQHMVSENFCERVPPFALPAHFMLLMTRSHD